VPQVLIVSRRIAGTLVKFTRLLAADPGVDTPVDPAAGPAAGLPAYPAVVTPPTVLAADP
jgi:hypothetical protein